MDVYCRCFDLSLQTGTEVTILWRLDPQPDHHLHTGQHPTTKVCPLLVRRHALISSLSGHCLHSPRCCPTGAAQLPPLTGRSTPAGVAHRFGVPFGTRDATIESSSQSRRRCELEGVLRRDVRGAKSCDRTWQRERYVERTSLLV